MDIREMLYFLTIAEERNLSRAADKLYLSQPSLSKFLMRLEESYGIQLFSRQNNALVLTKAGEVYRNAARQIINISRTADKAIEDIRDNSERSISIGVTGERSQRFVGKLLLQLYEEYPKLRVHVIEWPAHELARKLKSSEIDIAIYASSSPDNELVEIVLTEEEVVLALPKRHRLSPLGTNNPSSDLVRISLHELADDAFVLLRKSTTMRRIADAYFDKENFHPNEVIETKGSYSSMVFVDTGLAIGFCPANYKYMSDNICYIGLKDPFYYNVSLCFRKGGFLTKAMKRFITLAQESKEAL